MLLKSHQKEIHQKEEDTLLRIWEGRERDPGPAGVLTDGGEVHDVVYKKSSSKALGVEKAHSWFGRGANN